MKCIHICYIPYWPSCVCVCVSVCALYSNIAKENHSWRSLFVHQDVLNGGMCTFFPFTVPAQQMEMVGEVWPMLLVWMMMQWEVCVWVCVYISVHLLLHHKQSLSPWARRLFLFPRGELPASSQSFPSLSLTTSINYRRFSYFKFHLHSSGKARLGRGATGRRGRRAEPSASWRWGPRDGPNWIARPLD